MQAIQLNTDDQAYHLRIDKQYIDRESLMILIEYIRLEYLVGKAGFDENIEQLGEDIKAEWWKKNKGRFTQEVEQ